MASSERRVVQPGDINELASQLNDIAAIWDLFVGQLGVPYSKQQQISLKRDKHASFAQICLVDGLHHWVTSDPSPTIEKVIAALRSHAIDDKMLAGKIDEQWKVTATPVVEEPAPVEQTDSCTAASQLVVAKPKAKRCYSVDQAEVKSEQLQDDFIALVSEMKDLLIPKWTNLRKFCDHFILKLPLSIKEDNEKFFAGKNTEISKATTFDELFICLDTHWNYLNHSLLQGFSKAFGTPEYKRKFRAFTKKVAEFEKNITIEVFLEIEPPPMVDPPPGFEEFVTTHKLSLTSTLEDIERIRRKFCEKLELHTFAFYLVGFREGSVIITWLVPHSVARRLEAELGQEVKSKPSVAGDKAVVALHPGLKWKEYTLKGEKRYNLVPDEADILLISSSGVRHPEAISHLPPPQLTREEIAEYLTDQGVPPDCPLDDIEIAKARYSLDKESEIAGVEQSTSERPLTTSYVKSRIKELFRKTKKSQVLLYYHGPGRKDTGDWCFADGFITFQDIADLYMENFRGSFLIINSDCCYSGSWAKSCGEFLDKQGVQPCAHSARDKGILICVISACNSNEVAQSLYYSTRTLQNDISTGEICTLTDPAAPQQCIVISSIVVNCSNKTIEQPCTLPPDLTWEKQLARKEQDRKMRQLRCLYEAVVKAVFEESPSEAVGDRA